jgi:hypothetical protein
MTRTVIAGVTALAVLAAAVAAQAQPAASGAPPSGIGASVAQVIDKACLPLIHGQNIKTVAQAVGLKRSHDAWILPLAGGVEQITLSPPTTANPDVCTLNLSYEVDGTKALVDTLSGWAAAQTPPLAAGDAAYQLSPGVTSWTWTSDTAEAHEALVFNAQRTPDGKPLGRNADLGVILFHWRPGT